MDALTESEVHRPRATSSVQYAGLNSTSGRNSACQTSASEAGTGEGEAPAPLLRLPLRRP
jgi:hypothetical protein